MYSACINTLLMMSNPTTFCSSQRLHPAAQHQRRRRYHVQVGTRVAGIHQNEPVQGKLRSRWDNDHGAGARFETWVSAHMAQVQPPSCCTNLSGTVAHFFQWHRESVRLSAWTFVNQRANAWALCSPSATHVIPLILCCCYFCMSGSQAFFSWNMPHSPVR